jgi:hypothetical protein
MNWNIFCKYHKDDFKFTFSDSAGEINTGHWNRVVYTNNIYLSPEYLQALERSMQGTMDFRYMLVYDKDNQPVAAAAVQLLNFSGTSSPYRDLLNKAGVKVKYKLPESLDIKVVVCGNIFSCGENGFAFSDSINAEEAYTILGRGLDVLRKKEEKSGGVSFVLLKEFWPQTFTDSDVLKGEHFRDFMIDVNMVLKIDQRWSTLEDYFDSMNAKFRTKANGVFKKSKVLTVADLSKEEIETHKTRIEELHAFVVDKADFNVKTIGVDAFVNFKKALGSDFIFKGYFLEKKLIGFTSAFVFNGIADANFVGIDYNFNHDYALYPRMLYDLVELGISRKCTELRLGRTAEEIKSSLGAEPVNMKLYIKHGNRISNSLLKPIIDSIAPSKFELRKPFKQIQEVAASSQKPGKFVKKELLQASI